MVVLNKVFEFIKYLLGHNHKSDHYKHIIRSQTWLVVKSGAPPCEAFPMSSRHRSLLSSSSFVFSFSSCATLKSGSLQHDAVCLSSSASLCVAVLRIYFVMSNGLKSTHEPQTTTEASACHDVCLTSTTREQKSSAVVCSAKFMNNFA